MKGGGRGRREGRRRGRGGNERREGREEERDRTSQRIQDEENCRSCEASMGGGGGGEGFSFPRCLTIQKRQKTSLRRFSVRKQNILSTYLTLLNEHSPRLTMPV